MKALICAKCDKSFTLLNWVYNNRIKNSKSKKLFCSSSCSASAKVQEDSPNWKGGVSEDQYNRYRKSYPEKYIAQNRLRCAVQRGVIEKQACQKCGDLKSEAHHPDYSKPLEVIWLCHKCHMGEHSWKEALEWVLGEHGPLDERVHNCDCARARIRKELEE